MSKYSSNIKDYDRFLSVIIHKMNECTSMMDDAIHKIKTQSHMLTQVELNRYMEFYSSWQTKYEKYETILRDYLNDRE